MTGQRVAPERRSQEVRSLSKTTVLTCALLFVAGVVAGILIYVQRSPAVEQQVPGTNAIATHIVLALVAVGLFIGLPRLRLAQRPPTRYGRRPSRSQVTIVSSRRYCCARASRREISLEPSSPACCRSCCCTTSFGQACSSSEALTEISPSTHGVGPATLARCSHIIWMRSTCSTLRRCC